MKKHKNDPKTLLAFSKSLSKVADQLDKDARDRSSLAANPKIMVDSWKLYEEAARKSYAASILRSFSKQTEVAALIELKPNRKCQFCGGKASICYPRHLVGRSCA